MSQKSIALSKTNFIICGIAILLIIAGFLLMTGSATTLEGGFEPDIFSARRIKLAPIVSLAGFVLMVVGILYPSKEKNSVAEK
ncbi:DUF3098 domain-containing protein [Proteiniphilum sp.]|uniref:DUF3098 domain-containing protein n=1 Tax=Proteiniphilum sp. TaxID=1926877 RepID=UPI002B200DD9|nr:DUF3098 domain-containing protein [Proteiniphilum sp.]MEA4918322.1 DUF3098 domain-containing protein [Proteiniphilum sp.]